ncbi:hypothetical protein HDV00_011103 [Rhizophlyctis rosea]|nr:hypothetical protein HDV00_011103 [Rhizophlyctis rosea]
MDKVYEQLDPDYDRDIPNAGQAEEDLHASTLATDSNAPQKDLQQTAAEGVETFLSAIDKTFDYASNTLGNTLLTGYKKLEEANLGERARAAVNNITRDIDQSMRANQTVQSGGAVLNQTFNALESLGKTAVNMVGAQARQTWSDESAEDKAVKPSRPTIERLFEDNAGSAHLQALQALANESTSKFRTLQPDRASTQLSEINTLLNPDTILEDAETHAGGSLIVEEDVQNLLDKLKALDIEDTTQIRALSDLLKPLGGSWSEDKVAAFTKDLSMLRGEESDSDASLQATKDLLDSIAQEATQLLASFTEKSCEQILRIAESLLLRANKLQDGTSDEDEEKSWSAVDAAGALQAFVAVVISETTWASDMYVRTLQGLEIAFKEQHREMPAVTKAISHAVESLEATVARCTEFATSTVQEAAEYVTPILKLVAVLLADKD